MECPPISSFLYEEFARGIYAQSQRQRLPLDGTLELTFRCNLNCTHCYCNLPADDKQNQAKELTTKEILRILDEITAEGCLWLLLTGGEPLLREDFKEIYLFAKRKGMLVTLFTNGTLITEGIADLLRDYPPFLVEITIYGATPKTYEAVTRAPGSFLHFCQGMDFLLQRKIPLKLKSMITKINYSEFQAMSNFSKQRGVHFRFDALINPRLDGSLSSSLFRSLPQEVVNLDLIDERRILEFKKSYQEYVPTLGSEFLYYCSAGEDVFSINPYGHLQLCQMVTKPYFDLRQGTFHYGWRKFFPKLKSLPRSGKSTCDTCRARPLCGHCPGWAKLESKNAEAPIQYLCEVAFLREEVFGLKNKEVKDEEGISETSSAQS